MAGRSLPGTDLLRARPDLEASALRAMDILAPARVVAILHADDPVFLSTSRGALNSLLGDVAIWAKWHRAAFHQSKSKTVVMVTGLPAWAEQNVATPPVVMPASSGNGLVQLEYKQTHRWLGVLWSSHLSFESEFEVRVAIASSAFAPLASLVSGGIIPITFATQLFESKVDSILNLSRWLIPT